MQDKITAPNNTQVPNNIFDYWMAQLTPAEFKVLLCLCRKTFGWQKPSDKVSLKQIQKMTQLHKSGIIKNLKRLIELGLVTKIKSKTSDGDDAPNEYEIRVYSVEGGSLLTRQQVVDSVDNPVVDSVDTQKKDYTKEILTKEDLSKPKNLVRTGKSSSITFSFDSKKFINITKGDMESWKEAYPCADISKEIARAVEWCLSNEKKASSRKHWRQFLNSWLRKSDDYSMNRQAYSKSNNQSSSRHFASPNNDTFDGKDDLDAFAKGL